MKQETIRAIEMPKGEYGSESDAGIVKIAPLNHKGARA